MRILITIKSVFLAGAEQVALRLAQQLTLFGHEVYLLTNYYDTSGFSQENLNNVNIITQDKIKNIGLRKPISYVNELYEGFILSKLLRRFLRTHDVDIINSHNNEAAWAVMFSKSTKPWIWTCNDFYRNILNLMISGNIRFDIKFRYKSLIYDTLDNLAARKTTMMCVLSKMMRNYIQKRVNYNPIIIRTPIDDIFFHEGINTETLLKKINIEPEKDFLILQAGWLTPEKNPLSSLLAIKKLQNRIPNIKLVFAGKGMLENYLKKLSKELNISDKIIFAGWLGQKDIATLYSLSKVCLFVPKRHAWGLAPFEAALKDCIPIVSKNTGAAEVFQELRIGGVIMEPTPAQIADAIYSIYSNFDFFHSKLEIIKDFIKKNLTYRVYARKMEKLFNIILRS
jgi:glycosyltransferase involved in cell wall biosynthesis